MGTSRWGGIVSLVALGVCAAAAPAVASPAWTGNAVLSRSGEAASEPAVAVSADGRVVAAWVAVRGEVEISETLPEGTFAGSGPVAARLGMAGHGWRGAQVLSSDGEDPIAAVGANGTGAVAWCRRPKPDPRRPSQAPPLAYVSIASPGRRFGSARLVETRGGCPEALEVQPDGRVVLVRSRVLEYNLAPLSSRIRFALLRPHGGRPFIGTVAASVPGGVDLSSAETEAGDVVLDLGQGNAEGPQSVAQLEPGAGRFTRPQALNAAADATIREAHMSAGPGGAALVFSLEPEPADGEAYEDAMAEQQPNGAFGHSARPLRWSASRHCARATSSNPMVRVLHSRSAARESLHGSTSLLALFPDP